MMKTFKEYLIESKTETISKYIAKAVMHVANKMFGKKERESFYLYDLFKDNVPSIFRDDFGDYKVEKIVIILDSSKPKEKTHVTGAVYEASDQMSLRGMYRSTGFIAIYMYLSEKSKDGFHESERNDIYNRLINVIRHEIEHLTQTYKPSTVIANKFDDYDIKQKQQIAKKHFYGQDEKESRAMGGYLQAKKERVSLREIYRRELNMLLDNMKSNFNMTDDDLADLYNDIEDIIEDQISILQKRIGHGIYGFMGGQQELDLR